MADSLCIFTGKLRRVADTTVGRLSNNHEQVFWNGRGVTAGGIVQWS